MTSNEWYNKGIALQELKRYGEALDAFDKALEISPDNAKILFSKGIALKNLMKYEEALQTFDRSLEINLLMPESGVSKLKFFLALCSMKSLLTHFIRQQLLLRKTLRYGIEEGWHSGR